MNLRVTSKLSGPPPRYCVPVPASRRVRRVRRPRRAPNRERLLKQDRDHR